MTHRRKQSLSKQKEETMSLYSLIQLLDPSSTQQINLEDMKNILQSLPESIRPKVESIFHNFIFDRHCFELPIIEFIRRFEEKTLIDRKNQVVHRPSVSEVSRKTIFRSKKLKYCLTNNNSTHSCNRTVTLCETENKPPKKKKKVKKRRRSYNINDLIHLRRANLQLTTKHFLKNYSKNNN